LTNAHTAPARPVCTAWTHHRGPPTLDQWPGPSYSATGPTYRRSSLGEFLRDYPRPLEARPPLNQKATFREWVDPVSVERPGNAVGKSWKRRRLPGLPNPTRQGTQSIDADAEKLSVV